MTAASRCDLLIAGGGAIGLTAAWYAARQGLQVTLLDPQDAAAASPAAAGVLWPLESLPSASAFWPWVRQAVAGWDVHAATLHELTGIDLSYAQPGLLRLSADAESLQHGEVWRAAQPLDTYPPGAWVAQARRVDPPALVAALRQAVQQAGVCCRSERLLALPASHVAQTSAGPVEFGRAVLATGAWDVSGLPAALQPRPVRGQMLELVLAQPWSGPILQDADTYLVPIDGGRRAWLGATLEEVGFDGSTSTAARAQIWAGAQRLLDCIGPARIVRQWAGLRPRVSDGAAPAFGIDQQRPELALALGAYRLGITLSPAWGQRLADWARGTSTLPLVGW